MLTALTLLPLLTTGQLGVVSITVGDGAATTTVGPSLCGQTISAPWTATVSGFVCSDLDFWVTAGTCGATIVPGDLPLPAFAQATLASTRSGKDTLTIPVDSLFSLNSDAGTSTSTVCGAAGASLTLSVCGAVTVATDATCLTKEPIQAAPVPTITYDTVPPSIPVLGEPDALDSTITVPISCSSDTDHFYLFLANDISDGGISDFAQQSTAYSLTATNPKVDGLVNGTRYYLKAQAYDLAGNPSGFSNIVSGTPKPTTGFWGEYRADGGAAQGCSSAPGALAVGALALIGVAMLRRRRS